MTELRHTESDVGLSGDVTVGYINTIVLFNNNDINYRLQMVIAKD